MILNTKEIKSFNTISMKEDEITIFIEHKTNETFNMTFYKERDLLSVTTKENFFDFDFKNQTLSTKGTIKSVLIDNNRIIVIFKNFRFTILNEKTFVEITIYNKNDEEIFNTKLERYFFKKYIRNLFLYSRNNNKNPDREILNSYQGFYF